ncbi:MAG: multi-sensor hybrid histidine kinase [Bacteroidota bacterium]|jgi:signal transduction histidine kinase|nr:multi-sensor hybrid histidine kinase [Bacteroidota bacterium]
MKYRKIFWKVVAGFAITACLLGVVYWITFNHLNALKENLTTLSEVNPKYVYRERILKRVDDTENFVKRYTINKNKEFLYECDSCINAIGEDMHELGEIALDNPAYAEQLAKLNKFINRKLTVARQRIELANAYSSGKELSSVIEHIAIPEKKSILPVMEEKKEPAEKKRFFSRFFSRDKNKPKPLKDTVKTVDADQENEFSAGYMKEMLIQAEQKETEKSNQYLRENILLIDQNDRIHDSIRAIATEMEQLEKAESVAMINELSEETTNKTADILSSLIILGFLAMILFIIVVYREVKFNDRLRRELIQEKKNTEQLAKAKEEFLANMSHEIRTPMNVIMGFSDQLLKTSLNNEQQKFLLNIRRSSKHLLTVINEILDYSKMESGVITLENIPFSIEEVISDVHATFSSTAEKKGIGLEYSIDKTVAKKVMGDPVRLKQILLNLTGNAIKFTEKGSVKVVCKLWSQENDIQDLLFEVEDTGIGIPEEAMPKIFEQFTQADSSVTRKYGGTGLGLAISRKLIELHEGQISVKSEVGTGSVFYFHIRYCISDDCAEPVDRKELRNTQMLADKRILIADDDEMNKFLAQHILEGYKVNVSTADNGRVALEKILNQSYDLVLMDLHMPEMGGIDVVKTIRKQGVNVPVIAVTGNVIKSEKENCIDAGMNDYISKPYDENEILQKIIDLLPVN